MILLFGGTTEGRTTAARLEKLGRGFIYSTKLPVKDLALTQGSMRYGVLDDALMRALIDSHAIRTIIDAAHPFAVGLHRTISRVSRRSGVRVIRIERPSGLTADLEQNRHCSIVRDIDEALQVIGKQRPERLLALTGVQSIPLLRPWWELHNMKIRILPTFQSVLQAGASGFPPGDLIMMKPSGDQNDEERIIRAYGIDCILTKESGQEGFLPVKIRAAEACRVPLVIIRRPRLPDFAMTLERPDDVDKFLA